VKFPYDEQRHAVADHSADVHEAAVASIEVARLRRAFRTLPELERRVLAWRFGLAGTEQLSIRQIATRLGLSVGTVWNLEQRGLEALRSDYGIYQEAAA
jgi:RNA polymerase sigma factor (sigma-70 family)